MRFVVIFYILSTLVYFGVGEGTVFWSVFNMASILLVVCYMFRCFLHSRMRVDKITKELIFVALVMTATRILYSTACALATYEWIYLMNKLFAIIFATWILILTIITINKR